MKSKLAFISISAVIIFAVVLMFAVSVEKKTDTTALQGQADSALVNKDNIKTDGTPEQTIPLEPEPAETLQVSFANVKTVTFWGDRVAAGTDGGVFTYKPEDSSYQFFYYANGLTDYDVNAILQVGDKLLVGTQGGLSVIDKAGNIQKIDFGFNSAVTALAESQGSILIGTADDGLIEYSEGTSRKMLDVDEINAVVSTGDQVWVATDGFGLYSFDGMKWKKRYLIDDSTAFDCVSDLGAKFDRIYAGTPFGLYVFNGGRWSLYNEDNGLLMPDVREIAFKGWKIIVGTSDWGIYEIFEDWVTPRAWSEGMEITALASDGDYTVVGTPHDGIYIANQDNISHINPSPQTFTRPIVASIQ